MRHDLAGKQSMLRASAHRQNPELQQRDRMPKPVRSRMRSIRLSTVFGLPIRCAALNQALGGTGRRRALGGC